MGTKWVFQKEGREEGPFSERWLKELHSQIQITDQTLVSEQGAGNWRSFGEAFGGSPAAPAQDPADSITLPGAVQAAPQPQSTPAPVKEAVPESEPTPVVEDVPPEISMDTIIEPTINYPQEQSQPAAYQDSAPANYQSDFANNQQYSFGNLGAQGGAPAPHPEPAAAQPNLSIRSKSALPRIGALSQKEADQRDAIYAEQAAEEIHNRKATDLGIADYGTMFTYGPFMILIPFLNLFAFLALNILLTMEMMEIRAAVKEGKLKQTLYSRIPAAGMFFLLLFGFIGAYPIVMHLRNYSNYFPNQPYAVMLSAFAICTAMLMGLIAMSIGPIMALMGS